LICGEPTTDPFYPLKDRQRGEAGMCVGGGQGGAQEHSKFRRLKSISLRNLKFITQSEKKLGGTCCQHRKERIKRSSSENYGTGGVGT